MNTPSTAPTGLACRIRQFMAAVKRDDVPSMLRLCSRVPRETRLAALKWSVVHAPLTTLETLAEHWFRGQLLPARLNDPFDVAIRNRRWDGLVCLLDHAPPGGLAGESVLLLACLHHAPPLLVDRLVKACQSGPVNASELWDKTFQDAVYHDHITWMKHAWTQGLVSESARVAALLRSVDRERWSMIDTLLTLGPIEDLSPLVKASRSPGACSAIDHVASRLPGSLAHAFMDQLSDAVRPLMSLTQLRLLADARHDQVLEYGPVPAPRPGRPRA